MSAEEKILQGILDDAKAQADKILSDGEAVCREITAQTEQMVKSYSATTTSNALISAKNIKQNAESAAELIVRDAKLAKRHSEIEKTLGIAKEKILSLSDKEYFSLLSSLAVKNARKGEEGTLILGKSDLKRNTEEFLKLLKQEEISVQISKTPADISGGFILKYGDIEYNLTIDAVINDKREVLEDKINSILFSE